MLVVITKFMVKPDMVSEFTDTWLPVAEESRNEVNCLSYQLCHDMKDENTLYTVGTWTDEAALHEHMTAPFVVDGIAKTTDMLATAPEWTFCQGIV